MVIYNGAGALSLDSRQKSTTKELNERDRVSHAYSC
jgi:hypothetical protein